MDFERLQGRWHLSRMIEDRRAGLTGKLVGHAVWTPDAKGLVQTETGTLSYGNAAPMQATRRYLWRADGQELHVCFDDERPFHIVPKGREEARHDCPPDIYRVQYAVEGPDRFTTRWHVTGPRKYAVLTSVFTKDNGVKP